MRLFRYDRRIAINAARTTFSGWARPSDRGDGAAVRSGGRAHGFWIAHGLSPRGQPSVSA